MGELVHVFAANSETAQLPPSLEYTGGGSGQAKPYESGQNVYRVNGGWREGNPPIQVVGIPTLEPLTQKKLEHYIAGLYFQAAKGNSICLPIRKIDSSGKNKHLHPEKPANFKIALPLDKEYAFGGGVTNTFGPKWGKFLEEELNKLDVFLQRLIAAKNNTEENKLIAALPLDYKKAFQKVLATARA